MAPSAEGLGPVKGLDGSVRVRGETLVTPSPGWVRSPCFVFCGFLQGCWCESCLKGGARMKLRESLTQCPDTCYQVTYLDLRLT